MSDQPAFQIVNDLKKLGVSEAGIIDLLTHYPHDVIERQLTFLPFRKAKNKRGFIIEAIRNDYSAPKEFYYASSETPAQSTPPEGLDKNAEPNPGLAHAESQGHGTADSPHRSEGDGWLASGGETYDLDLPDTLSEDGPQ